MITPLHDAISDGVPMLSLTGQVPTAAIGTDAFQECPAIELTKACTKWSYQLKKTDNIEEVINHAIHLANSDRKGPVHIDLPKDIMSLDYDVSLTNLQNFTISNKNVLEKNNNKYGSIRKFITLLNKSKKPVVVAGNGCLDSSPELREFIKKANIPITTTIHGMGVYDERDFLSLHMLGMHGSVYANYAVQNADMIIGIGCRFDDRITGTIKGYGLKAFQAADKGTGGIVHIDNNATQIKKVKKMINPSLSILYDTKEFLADVLTDNKINTEIDRSEWLYQIEKWKNKYPFFYKPSEKGTPKTQEVIKKLYSFVNKNNFNDDMIVTTGVGNHQMMSSQFYRWSRPRSILTSGSAGVMGAGLPFAVGAQVANPNKTVVLIDGDGSFNMTFNDLGTVAEKNLPLKMIVLNDGRQQMVHIWQKLFFNERFVATDNFNPDYVKLAESFGIQSIKCDRSSDIDTAIELMFDTKSPILVEFKIEPDICLPLVAPGKNLDEMVTDYSEMVPMEGLAPS